MAKCARKHRLVLRGCRLTVMFRYARCRVRYTIDLSDWSLPDRLLVNGQDWSARDTARTTDLRAAAKDVLYTNGRRLTAARPLLA